MSQRPVLSATDRAKSYAKYYDLSITPIPPDKVAILEGNPMAAADMLPITRMSDLFLPGYLQVESGYGIAANGTGYVANLTHMPGVTPGMFEWWFAWHGLDDLRYKIWDPEDHFYARQQMPEKVLNPDVPMREKTWGTVHHVLEDIGAGPDKLILNFLYPRQLGLDEEKVGTDACATIMCANGHGPTPGEGVAAMMLHFVRELSDGIELRTRFWIGYGLTDGKIAKLVPDNIQIPVEVPQGLFAHNLKEFGHLAKILPNVYNEEKERF